MYFKRFITVLILISLMSIKKAYCSYFADMDERSASLSSSSLLSQEENLSESVDGYFQYYKEKRGIAVKANSNLIITPLFSIDVKNLFMMWQESRATGDIFMGSIVKPGTEQHARLSSQLEIYEKTSTNKRQQLKFLHYGIYFIEPKNCEFAGLLTVKDPYYEPDESEIEEIESGWSDIHIIIRPKFRGKGIAYHAIKSAYTNLFKPLIGQNVICHSYERAQGPKEDPDEAIRIKNEHGADGEFTIRATASPVVFKGLQAQVAYYNNSSEQLFNKLGWERIENVNDLYESKIPTIFRFPPSKLNSINLDEGESEDFTHDKEDNQHQNMKKRKISAISPDINYNFLIDEDREMKKHKH